MDLITKRLENRCRMGMGCFRVKLRADAIIPAIAERNSRNPGFCTFRLAQIESHTDVEAKEEPVVPTPSKERT